MSKLITIRSSTIKTLFQNRSIASSNEFNVKSPTSDVIFNPLLIYTDTIHGSLFSLKSEFWQFEVAKLRVK